MAQTIGTATITIKADTSGFLADLKAAERQAGGFGSGFGNVSSTITQGFRKIGSAGLIAGYGFYNAGQEAIQFGADTTIAIDNALAMFRGLTDSEAEAQAMLESLTQYAIDTPFELPGLANVAAQLIAVGDGFGVNTDNITGWLDTYGNAVAATGGNDETLQRVVRVFGQISSSGKVLGQDMTQLAQNIPGFDVWQALADGTGKSVEELRAMQDLGTLDELLTGNEAVVILTDAMKELPGASGAMERKMDTLEGSMSKFKEQMGLALYAGLKPFFDTFQKVLANPAIQNALDSLIAVFSLFITEVFEKLEPHLPTLIDSFVLLLEALLPLTPVFADLVVIFAAVLTELAPAIELFAGLTAAITGWLASLDPKILTAIAVALGIIATVGFGWIAVVIAAVIALGVYIADNWEAITKNTRKMVDQAAAAWDWFYENVIERVVSFVKMVISWFTFLYDILVGNSIIPDLVEAIVALWEWLYAPIEAAVTAIWDVIVLVWDAIKAAVELTMNAILTVVTTVWDTIKTAVDTALGLIETAVSTSWDAIKLAIDTVLGLISTAIDLAWTTLATTVGIVWDGVKAAIVDPIQGAYDFVKEKVDLIGGLVSGALDAINSIPGAGLVKQGIGLIPGLAEGGIVNHPTLAMIGEGRGAEAVIPLTNPGRAMQLMRASGLDQLAGQMGGSGGPLVQMNGTVIQDATDADLVAQRTVVAIRAAMVA